MIWDAVTLLTLGLAAWRLAYLVTREDAPFRVMARLRARTTLGGLLTCIRCASVWSAALVTMVWWYTGDIGRVAVVVLAASALGIMLDSYTGASR